MSMQPAYAAIPILEVVNFFTANSARDGSGTIATLVTGEAPGTRVERILVQAVAATTVNVIRFWIKEANADTWRLMNEMLVEAITPSTTVAAWTDEYAPTNGINLGLGHMLGISVDTSVANAQIFNAFVFGGRL